MATRTPQESRTRTWLALAIVGLSVVGIAAVSAVAMIWASDADRPEAARLVFSAVLPLLGTWVGTVLAFYFARENLQAATDSTIRLAGGLRADTPVTEVMIPRTAITAVKLAANQNAEDVPLADLVSLLGPGRRRIPILDSKDAVIYVVHEATLTAFAAAAGKQLSQLTEKMSDLLARSELAKAVQAIAVVPPTAVLEEARARMKAVEGCNDVFVTSGGQRQDPVVGWLTNTDLAQAS